MLLAWLLATAGLACLLAVSGGTAEAAQQADLARLKASLVDCWVGAEADREHPQARAPLQRVEQQARAAPA
jgi:hypothetical protein